MENVCYICGAGDYYKQPILPKKGDYVIAADAGYIHLFDKNVPIDEVIGDFDSTGFIPNHPNVLKLPAEKDDTDMLFAIRRGIEKGYREFHLFGGMGGRIDHTLANIQCLVWLARQGMRGFLYGDGCLLTSLYNSSIILSAPQGSTLSIFAQENNVYGVTLSGLKYELVHAEMSNDFPIGISNEFMNVPAKISVDKGTLVICFPDCAKIL